MSTPNVDLLRRTLARIEAEPKAWLQSAWMTDLAKVVPNECGTAYCFGGHAVVLYGNVLDMGERGNLVHPLPGDDVDPDETWRENGRPVMETWDYARTVLGLTEDQADALFNMYNELDDLRRIVTSICESADR
jgi:hypothetical protein